MMKAVLRQLRNIPGVGPSIAQDLVDLGIHSIAQLNEYDPEQMYIEHCVQKGTTVDRCILYVFRCAVYYASTSHPDPELLKWWNWKDRS
jgi:hypothetical protein